MARKAIPASVQAEVLLKSRRRCCICFGLNRDANLKPGQIAHLDKDNTNNSEENLCFLCLTHHDEYDSVASQRKNYTINEVKAFRKELYDSIGTALSMPVHFGSISLPPRDPYAGKFLTVLWEENGAELMLTPVPDSSEDYPRYCITGTAMYGMSREYGPNIGELSFVATMYEEGVIEYNDYASEITYTIRLVFIGDTLRVFEDGQQGRYGHNVTFSGIYKRA